MTRAPRRLAFLAALAAMLAAAFPASAGPSMSTANNAITRDVDDGGGVYSASGSGAGNNQMTGAAAEEVARSTSTSGVGAGNNLLRAGFSTIASYPGTLTSLTVRSDIGSSSMTFNWATPGYDGALGTAQSGSAYLVQAASAAFLGNLSSFANVAVTVSTSGTTIGKGVGATATDLDGNTTFYAQVMLRDNDGDVGGAFTTAFTTADTLALAPATAGTLEFTSIQISSASVAWVAPFQTSVASMSNEGYILLASSDNFGAISLPTPAPVISSETVNIPASVLLSTLTVGLGALPLNLASTYYFAVGSLNWSGSPNYTTLTKLNFQIAQSTGLLSFTLNPNVARSTVATSSMVVTNVGNWPASIELAASTATMPSSPWALGTTPAVETAVLMGVWYTGALGPPAVGPPVSEFSTFLTTTPVESSGVNYFGNQSGVKLASGGNITLWSYFTLPTTSQTTGSEVLLIGAEPVYP